MSSECLQDQDPKDYKVGERPTCVWRNPNAPTLTSFCLRSFVVEVTDGVQHLAHVPGGHRPCLKHDTRDILVTLPNPDQL